MKRIIEIDELYYEMVKQDVKVYKNDFKPYVLIANSTPINEKEKKKMDDKLEIEMEMFNEMMDELHELYTATYNSDEKNGIVKSRCVLYEYFRHKYSKGGVDNENK